MLSYYIFVRMSANCNVAIIATRVNEEEYREILASCPGTANQKRVGERVILMAQKPRFMWVDSLSQTATVDQLWRCMNIFTAIRGSDAKLMPCAICLQPLRNQYSPNCIRAIFDAPDKKSARQLLNRQFQSSEFLKEHSS